MKSMLALLIALLATGCGNDQWATKKDLNKLKNPAPQRVSEEVYEKIIGAVEDAQDELYQKGYEVKVYVEPTPTDGKPFESEALSFGNPGPSVKTDRVGYTDLGINLVIRVEVPGKLQAMQDLQTQGTAPARFAANPEKYRTELCEDSLSVSKGITAYTRLFQLVGNRDFVLGGQQETGEMVYDMEDVGSLMLLDVNVAQVQIEQLEAIKEKLLPFCN
ncbi:MAG: hypothetical protein CL677_09540 [Bdellovibrionaceae bacterium]|nr:hypothetical protein [Pseudobdellovibrionaceae bacterium]